jgi:hypothetical protein
MKANILNNLPSNPARPHNINFKGESKNGFIKDTNYTVFIQAMSDRRCSIMNWKAPSFIEKVDTSGYKVYATLTEVQSDWEIGEDLVTQLYFLKP